MSMGIQSSWYNQFTGGIYNFICLHFQFPDKIPGFIARAIIDDDNFQARVPLPQQAAQADQMLPVELPPDPPRGVAAGRPAPRGGARRRPA